MRKWLLGSIGVLAIAACVGNDPVSTGAPGADGGGTTPGADGGSEDGGADACAASCKDDDTLIDCAGQEVACALGCSSTTKACRTFDPVGPVTEADLVLHTGELDVDMPATPEPVVIDTTSGSIKPLVGAIVRMGNTAADKREVVAGIGFERRGGVGIFTAKSWTLRNTIVRGDIPVAFVATTELKVLGHVSTACGEAGGGAAGDPRIGGGGDGVNDTAGGSSGGGGGGHGSAGARGGNALGKDAFPLNGGSLGAAFPFDAAELRGGGRGGVAGNPGGGGGGGVILVAAGSGVTIGDGVPVTYKPQGSTFTVPKGMHVGGCGGNGGRINGALPQKAGSGGGAGGLIVIEAPKLVIDANAGLAANGGSGGGTNTDGANGQLTDKPASEGVAFPGACATDANGGRGAAGATAAQPGSAPTGCGAHSFGGGGGGGGGRIMIRNRPGNVTDRAPTSILSPTSALEVQPLNAN